MSTESTLERVSAMIREVIGEDWDLDEEITLETSFSDDLELESIEFVSLAERIQAEYGGSVDFVAWLSGKELDEIISLKVGALVAFIEKQTGA
ncbi:MAG TPA: phosphopantetheine-binding protein [Planctomycetota bacterium]|nr:phosphopantetheine-binding protein [Planctomycetota bacterium]